MGADNWRICPQCVVKRAEAIRTAEALVLASYGTVSVDEYHELEARLDNMRQTAPEYTLREDYEIGTYEDAHFMVRYEASCSRCDFAFEFHHDQSSLNGG